MVQKQQMALKEQQLEQVSGGESTDTHPEDRPLGFLPGKASDYPWSDRGHCPVCGGTEFDHVGWGPGMSYQFYLCDCGTIFRK